MVKVGWTVPARSGLACIARAAGSDGDETELVGTRAYFTLVSHQGFPIITGRPGFRSRVALYGRRGILGVGVAAYLVVLLGEEIERICRIITAENGKTLMESRAEVEASLRDARYQLRAAEATN